MQTNGDRFEFFTNEHGKVPFVGQPRWQKNDDPIYSRAVLRGKMFSELLDLSSPAGLQRYVEILNECVDGRHLLRFEKIRYNSTKDAWSALVCWIELRYEFPNTSDDNTQAVFGV